MDPEAKKVLIALRDGVFMFAGILLLKGLSRAITFSPLSIFGPLAFSLQLVAPPVFFAASALLHRTRKWQHILLAGSVYWALHLPFDLHIFTIEPNSYMKPLSSKYYLDLIARAIFSLVPTSIFMGVGGGIALFVEAITKDFNKSD